MRKTIQTLQAWVLGAGLLTAAHAQPAPTAPTGQPAPGQPAEGAPQPGAERECLASFERDNAIKPEAGPFRVRVETGMPVAGALQRVSQVIEVAPPDGFRARSTAGGQASQTVSVGARRWVQAQGQWFALTDLTTGELREMFASYVDARRLRGLVCLPSSDWEGKAVRSYRYETPLGAGVARTLVRFDSATGLPLISDLQASTQPPTTQRFEFDPSIRIEAPPLD